MSWPRDLPRLLRTRVRSGVRRVRKSFWHAVQMTAGGIAAFAIAQELFGHEGPIFAATSAIIVMGFSHDPRLRRVLEVAIGCTIGILVGDILLKVLDAGLWQASAVLLTAILLARFLDSGSLFSTQMAIQSVLVVLLPVPAGGPFTRSVDAIVGGSVALLITALVPRDPRREPHANVRRVLAELAKVLQRAAVALETNDATPAWHALVRIRKTQPLIDEWQDSLNSAQEIARLAPAYRRHRTELEDLNRSLDFIELAVRNSDALVRRLASAINNAALSEEAMDSLHGLLIDTADAVETFGRALTEADAGGGSELDMRRTRDELIAVAARLHPDPLGVRGLQGEGVILLLRPLVVDLLEATGMRHRTASDHLPKLH